MSELSPPLAAVGEDGVGCVEELHRGKFPINRSTRIGAIGARWGQEIARLLKEQGFSISDEEPPPPGLTITSAKRFGYRSHSVRAGDFGTPRGLLQLMQEARGEFTPADAVWESNGRYFDALRPSVEPDGLARPETVTDHRSYHLDRVRHLFETSDVVLVTLDATEALEHEPSGTVYPAAPGQIAESLNSSIYRLRSFTVEEMYDDLLRFFVLCKDANPAMRFLIALSPETATEMSRSQRSQMEDSGSVLRAVADRLHRERDDIDYAPVEALSGRGNGRGSESPMEIFAAPISERNISRPLPATEHSAVIDDEELERMLAGDELCEEILNEAFKP